MQDFTPTGLQSYLDGKAATLGFSVVDHLRWDLTSIGDLAVAEKVLTANPARALYTPASARKGDSTVMTAADVEKALGVVAFREKVVLHLAIFSGLRPGEILALRRRSIGQDGSSVRIEQRVYRGDLDVPKNGKTRVVAVPPRSSALLSDWLATAVDPEPEAWVFASENRETPLWRDNLLRRHIRAQLEAVGLGWVDFKVMRRTNASLATAESTRRWRRISVDTGSEFLWTCTRRPTSSKGLPSPGSSRTWCLARRWSACPNGRPRDGA